MFHKQQIINFLSALNRFIEAGMIETDYKTYENRIVTCFKCEYKSKDWRCMRCSGCKIEIKARWVTEDCPEKKWGLPIIGDGKCGCGN